jgi:hypothetical protein
MLSDDRELQGLGVAPTAVPDSLRGWIRALRAEGIQPRDTRVKFLWDLLRQRGLLNRSPQMRALLLRMWQRGLPARPRPRTTLRVVRALRRWGVLPPRAGRPEAAPAGTLRPLRPLPVRAVRPVGRMQPVPAGGIRR